MGLTHLPSSYQCMSNMCRLCDLFPQSYPNLLSAEPYKLLVLMQAVVRNRWESYVGFELLAVWFTAPILPYTQYKLLPPLSIGWYP